MSIKEGMAVLEEIMDIDEGELTEETVLGDIEEWDSLSKLSLMAYVRRKFDSLLKPDMIGSFVTVGDILSYFQSVSDK